MEYIKEGTMLPNGGVDKYSGGREIFSPCMMLMKSDEYGLDMTAGIDETKLIMSSPEMLEDSSYLFRAQAESLGTSAGLMNAYGYDNSILVR